MTLDDSIKILAILKAAYPKDFPFNMSVEDAELTATVWCEQFLYVPGFIVEIAVKKLIATEEKPFPPAKVKKKIGSLYWEAKEMLESDERAKKFVQDGGLNEKQIAFYEAIKNATKDFKCAKTTEPSISQLISNETPMLLLGGG